MVWSVVKSRLPFLAEPFAELLGEKLTFTQMSCLTLTTDNFHQVLGALYVEDYYDKSYTAMVGAREMHVCAYVRVCVCIYIYIYTYTSVRNYA